MSKNSCSLNLFVVHVLNMTLCTACFSHAVDEFNNVKPLTEGIINLCVALPHTTVFDVHLTFVQELTT